MELRLNELIRIRNVTLQAMRALDGVQWHSATGELHYQYKEMPNWIMLNSSSDLNSAHQAFVEIFAPHFADMSDVNITVSYSVGRQQIAFLTTSAVVRAALSDPAFGTT